MKLNMVLYQIRLKENTLSETHNAKSMRRVTNKLTN